MKDDEVEVVARALARDAGWSRRDKRYDWAVAQCRDDARKIIVALAALDQHRAKG